MLTRHFLRTLIIFLGMIFLGLIGVFLINTYGEKIDEAANLNIPTKAVK